MIKVNYYQPFPDLVLEAVGQRLERSQLTPSSTSYARARTWLWWPKCDLVTTRPHTPPRYIS